MLIKIVYSILLPETMGEGLLCSEEVILKKKMQNALSRTRLSERATKGCHYTIFLCVKPYIPADVFLTNFFV